MHVLIFGLTNFLCDFRLSICMIYEFHDCLFISRKKNEHLLLFNDVIGEGGGGSNLFAGQHKWKLEPLRSDQKTF